jgi:6-pyruvoyltetrahydropterin/6-carboxytetrahydropterin synthase
MSRRFSIEVAKDYFNFASAHFLIFANGRREPLHGHNYQVAVAMEGELDRAGVVLDFITFKPLVKQVCDALDHRTLIQTNSSAIKVRKNTQEVEVLYKKQKLLLPRGDVKNKISNLPMRQPPTIFDSHFPVKFAISTRRCVSQKKIHGWSLD